MYTPVQLTNNWLGKNPTFSAQLGVESEVYEVLPAVVRHEDCSCIVFDSAEEVATGENEPAFKYSCGSFVSCHQFQAVSSHAAKQPSQVTNLLHQLVRSNLLSSCCCYTGLQTVRAQTASFT